MMAMEISVVLEQGEEGMFVAHCPALKSCWSQGGTRDEAIQNIREAVELYLEADAGDLPVDEQHEVVKLVDPAALSPQSTSGR
jgi:predicted RNase H-like HicB family nuclease